MRVLPYGDGAVLAEVDGVEAAAALAAALRRAVAAGTLPGVLELVPAARTVLVRFDPARIGPTRLSGALDEAAREPVGDPSAPAASEPVVIPVVYDGADLADVARLCGLSIDAVIQRHAAGDYRSAFCGFAPGFSYLIGGDPILHVPRLAEPRPAVPAGSVAIGGPFTAVYPSASPGGWRLLGRTDARMWDLDRAAPALAPPGTAVRFAPVRAGR